MTKKEELLFFIYESINETNFLLTEENIINLNEKCTKLYNVPIKEKLLNRINLSFNDDLIGQLPGDKNTIQIISWGVVDR